jgi:hypothetical protein
MHCKYENRNTKYVGIASFEAKLIYIITYLLHIPLLYSPLSDFYFTTHATSELLAFRLHLFSFSVLTLTLTKFFLAPVFS